MHTLPLLHLPCANHGHPRRHSLLACKLEVRVRCLNKPSGPSTSRPWWMDRTSTIENPAVCSVDAAKIPHFVRRAISLFPFVCRVWEARGVGSADAVAENRPGATVREFFPGAQMYQWLLGLLIATTLFVSFYAHLRSKRSQGKIQTKDQNKTKRDEKKPQFGLRELYAAPEPSVELVPALY